MNKVILSLFFLLFAIIYDSRKSHAQELLQKNDKYPENSWIEEVPVVCNYTDALHSFLESKGWIMYKTYTGKVGAEIDGKPVFIIAQYKNAKLPKSIIETVTVPSGQSCILYQGFDEKNTNSII
jgi:hypothetical protein